MAMTNKQRVFIEEYLRCWNASEAARLAGYKGKANVVGPRLLANVCIQAEIERRLEEKHLDTDRVLALLADHASGTMANFLVIDELGIAKFDLKKAQAAGKLHLIKSMSFTKEGTRIELYDSQSAAALIGKALGLFTDRSTNLNLDLSGLTDEQLERIASGEDPIAVLATTGRGTAGASPEAATESSTK